MKAEEPERCSYCRQVDGQHASSCKLKPRNGGFTAPDRPAEPGPVMYGEAEHEGWEDPVDHPSHYTEGSIECIDALESALGHDAFIGFCVGNAIKYAWRHRHKGTPVTDLRKAQWYLERALERIENEVAE